MEPIEIVERLGRWSSGGGPLYQLLAGRLRQLIDDGQLPPGVLLPPDRVLARTLAIGRSTAVAAYDQLAAEGRIVRRQGSGTRVAGAPIEPTHETTSSPVFLHLLEPHDGTIMLACAAPVAPPSALVDAYTEMLPRLGAATGIGYHPCGIAELRRAIADRYTERGTPTRPEQVLVTNGGQQALTLLARLFVRPGDPVIVEAPTYPGALEVLREQAARLHALPVGMDDLEAAIRRWRPALVYLVPTFHNPTGATLGSMHRQRLATVTERAGVPLVEDEILADLAFPGTDPPPAGPAAAISIGSLSKVLWGGLRIGWIRAEPAVVASLGRLRAVSDLGGNVPAQLVASHLVRRLHELGPQQGAELQRRHDILRRALANALPDWDVAAVSGGQTLWIRLPYGDGASYAQAAFRHGVALLPGDGLDITGNSTDRIRIHFQADPADLIEAVTRMATAWRTYHSLDHKVTNRPTLAV